MPLSALATVLADRGVPAPIAATLSRFLKFDRLDALHTVAAERRYPFEALLEHLDVQPSVTDADLAQIPSEGPVLMVANHPYGFLEGCLLDTMLRRVRPNFKMMANSLLGHFPAFEDAFLFVDPFGGLDAERSNRRALRRAIQYLRAGNMLVVFPAGEVAHMDLRTGVVTDPPWSPGAAGLARVAKATVVPAWFNGANSPLFHLMGCVHPSLRTAMLPHEFLSTKHRTVEIRIGSPIPAERMTAFTTDEEATAYMRDRSSLLRHRTPRHRPFRLPQFKQPIAAAADPEELAGELARLPADRRLTTSGDLETWYGSANEMPAILREIARLREVSFRRAGEGTGKALDTDGFDAHYLHLFLWNPRTQEIAGAYRMGRADHIRATLGRTGLYTSTLFHYDDRLLDRLGHALELGRSFVRHEYQRSYGPLLALWKGIGAWIARNPEYTTLFGPVSVSDEYHPVSRSLIAAYLTDHESAEDLVPLVRPRNPLRPAHRLRLWDLDELSSVVAGLEPDGKGIPVLLRQYLKLGGKLAACNVDRQFANALDALVVVDLRRTNPRILARYMPPGYDTGRIVCAKH